MKLKDKNGNLIEINELILTDDEGHPIVNEQNQPVDINSLYDVFKNQHDWNKKNTLRSEELKKQEKELEDLKKIVEEYKQVQAFFEQNPVVNDFISKYIENGNKVPVDYLKQVLNVDINQSQEKSKSNNFELPEDIKRKLEEYDRFIAEQKSKKQYQALLSKVKERFPDLDEKKFEEFYDKLDPNDESTVMELVVNAFLGTNYQSQQAETEQAETESKADIIDPSETVGDNPLDISMPADDYDKAIETYLKNNNI